jgi:hypothetical protein
MPVLSHLHQLFNAEQCQAYIHTLRWQDRPLQCPRCQSHHIATKDFTVKTVQGVSGSQENQPTRIRGLFSIPEKLSSIECVRAGRMNLTGCFRLGDCTQSETGGLSRVLITSTSYKSR